MKDGEMAKRVKDLAMQRPLLYFKAWPPEFDSQNPHKYR